MRRHLPRLFAALLIAAVPAVLGTLVALLYSPAGTLLLGRLVSEELTGSFRGTFTVRRVSGSFIRTVVLDSLLIRDTTGQTFAQVPHLSVHFALPNLLAGRIVFSDVRLEQPTIRLIKRTNGRLNFHEIFKLGESQASGKRPPLVELRDVQLHEAILELRLAWRPNDTLRTPEQVAAGLAAERARPGRIILETPDGLRKVVTMRNLNARLSLLRISSPDGAPLTFDVDSLATSISDPAMTVVDLAAHAWTRGDSLAFTLHRAALPHTRARGGGVVTWPKGPVRYDFSLAAERFDLRDLHWISPDFPDLAGRALLTAHSRSSSLNSYVLRELDARGPQGQVRGRVTVLTDNLRGLGVEDMALEVANLDMDVPRPYLDTIPLQGTLSGSVSGAGFLDGLDVAANLEFHDRRVPGGADNRMVTAGHLVFRGPEGVLFDTLVVDTADLDLRTVQLLAPAVELNGRVGLAGSLKGTWRNLTYTGRLTHQDDSRPVSRADGFATLDTRDSTQLHFDTRMNFAPLAFDGVRPSYPAIPSRGSISGMIAVRGTTHRFGLAAGVQGDIGSVSLSGTLEPRPGGFAAESLDARFTGLDLARLRGRGARSSLAGRLQLTGSYDTLAGPDGHLSLALSRGTAAELTLDTLFARAHAGSGLILIDTLEVAWPAGFLAGAGGLGWRNPGDDRLRFSFASDSLTVFGALVDRFGGAAADTLVARLAPPPLDSLVQPAVLSGHASGEVELIGSLQQPRLLVRVVGEDLAYRGIESPHMAVSFGWNGVARPEVGVGVEAETVTLGGVSASDVSLVAGGYQDSLRWGGSGSFGAAALVSGNGQYWTTGPDPVLTFDSLLAALPTRTWRLKQPVAVTLSRGHYDLSGASFVATDGSGSLEITGGVPRSGPADLKISAMGIPLKDVYTLLQRDTTGVAGTIQLDLSVGGTAATPTLDGTGSVADLSFGDFGSPFVQGIMHYESRRLDANLLLWKTGVPVLRVEASLPLDLALQSVPRRQVNGPLTVRARADSTDLSVVEAFTRTVRRVRGTLRAELEVEGSWDAPTLNGVIELRNASAYLPGLGVTYEHTHLLAHLSGDSISIDSLEVRSGEGSLRASGGLRVERLTRPLFNLTFRARRFRAIDANRFLRLDASGTVVLTGPVFQPRLTGRITADQGELHFADLITKRIVDLENPGDSGLIDLDLIRTEKLGANFQNRFLDSLTISNLQVQMGESFWLRSSEANIQLDGALTVNKVRDGYRYDGTLNAVRGNYSLRIGGIVTRDFTVERGAVRYFGTPDLNAELDIEARHVVIAAETSEEIPVIARITGTLLQPKLELQTAAAPNRPSLSQTELVSYLMFGRPTFSLQGQNGQGSEYAAVEAGLSYLSSALSSELQRSLISDLGVPIDYLDIRPGGAGTGLAGQNGSAQVAQVAAGWQIGRRWFVTLVADLCTNTQRFYPNAEFRMSRQIRLKTSVEPAYSCQVAANQPALSVNKYQVGLDLLWEREY